MLRLEEFQLKRVRIRKEGTLGKGAVLYWMQRDQRVHDNWALLYAQTLAIQYKRPLWVAYIDFPSMSRLVSSRQRPFLLAGLQQVKETLDRYLVPFGYLQGNPELVLPELAKGERIAAVVTDFTPLRERQTWLSTLEKSLSIPIYEVDAHNIVPAWVASDKQEWAARTFRPKVNRHLGEYLTDFPRFQKHPYSASWNSEGVPDFGSLEKSFFFPGEISGRQALDRFLLDGLNGYHANRNDPNVHGQSELSPWLHFGHLAPQRVAYEVQRSKAPEEDVTAFLEELVVRRELSDNYCLYCDHYDSAKGFPDWAQKTLAQHKGDKREYLYTYEEFEGALTHDHLWNAAQSQLLKLGKIHGYMRMYWAKKILEWTSDANDAFRIGLTLNDKYSLDGCDPNGYVGVAWSVGGVHDRAWQERPIFGKIRYMSAQGCARKFDLPSYCKRNFTERD